MPTTTIAGRQIDVDAEGFLTQPDQWDEDLALTLAANIGITLPDAHWVPIHFLRKDFETQKETATLRRVSTVGGIPVKDQFVLFPGKPAKKMSYIAGLQKPKGCV